MQLTTVQKIVIGVIVIGGAVGGYLLWKEKKKKADTSPALNPTTNTPSTTAPSPTSPTANQSATKTTALNNSGVLSDVLGFQKWYNVKGYKPKLDEDGQAGPKTNAAFAKYGVQYNAIMASQTKVDAFKPVYKNDGQSMMFSNKPLVYSVTANSNIEKTDGTQFGITPKANQLLGVADRVEDGFVYFMPPPSLFNQRLRIIYNAANVVNGQQ